MALPNAAQYTALRNAAMHGAVGGDLDLPADDRRSRPTFINGRPLVPNQNVTIKDTGLCKVLGPGRGRDWFLAGWIDDVTGDLCIGTFNASHIED